MASTGGLIDVHVHTIPAAYRDALIRASAGNRVPPDWSAEAHVEMMDRHGIGTCITSIAASWTFIPDPAEKRDLARRCNDFAAELVARRPSRFGAFAAIPLPDVDAAVKEVRYAFENLKLDGIGLFTSYNGRNLGDPAFDPVMQALNDYEAVVFIHPTDHPSADSVRIGVHNPLLEFVFDTTRAAVNLVLSASLDRFPRIRFILSHAGGTLPFIAWRIAELGTHQMTLPQFREQYPQPLLQRHSGEVTHDLFFSRFRRFYYDTALSPGPATFGSLTAVADPSRILFGSDWPYTPKPTTANMIDSLNAPGFLSEDQRASIDRGNALPLFPRLGPS